MKIAPIADVKAHLSSYIDQSEEGPIIITRNGRPVAMLIATPDEAELERAVLAHTPRFRRLLDAAEERIRETGGLSNEAFWDAVDPTDRAPVADEPDSGSPAAHTAGRVDP